MKLKIIILSFFLFLAGLALSPTKNIESVQNTQDTQKLNTAQDTQNIQNTEDTQDPKAAREPTGIWVLDKAQTLFKGPVHLEFYMHGKELQARKVEKKANTLSANSLSSETPRSPLLWNLRKKNGEYLYGWLRAEKGNRIYRCKLWKRQTKLFLRVYTQAAYDTYELKPLLL